MMPMYGSPGIGPQVSNIHVCVPTGEVDGMPVGAIVVVEVRGRITGMSEEDAGKMSLTVEGTSSVRPGTLNDAATLAFGKLSNAKEPPPFLGYEGQRELHAP